MNYPIIAGLLGVLLIGIALKIKCWSSMLRDISTAGDRPFSFARCQMMWWTLIVVVCFLIYFGTEGAVPQDIESCLVVLGIGAATTMTARMIDDRQRSIAAGGGAAVHQDEESQGFLTDILSDGHGMSVHRFQALIFNVIFGVSFLVQFLRLFEFPDYNQLQYALLGISSAGYLSVKVQEQAPTTMPQQKAHGNDELLDPNPVD